MRASFLTRFHDQKHNRRARGRRGGRPPAFDAAHYRERNTAGRCFSKLTQVRAAAELFDKRELIYRGPLDAASIRVWLRGPVS